MKLLQLARGSVQAVAYSAAGRYLVSLDSGNALRFWSLADYREKLALPLPHFARVPSPQLALLGTRVVLRTSVWQLAGVWKHLDAGTDLSYCQVSLEGRPERLVLVPREKGEEVLGLSTAEDFVGPDRLYRWSGDGRFLAQVDLAVHLVTDATVSPDGRTLAVPDQYRALLIDVATGWSGASFRHGDSVADVAWSPDGGRLAVVAGRSVVLWSVADRKQVRRFPAFPRSCDCVAFHPHGLLLAAGGRTGEVRFWDAQGGGDAAGLDPGVGGVQCLAFSPDGMTVAAAGQRSAIAVWDLE